MASFTVVEGEVAFEAPNAGKPCKTWYKIVGSLDSEATPVVALHGGPGAGSAYLSPYIDLYTLHNVPVILYDQIGCGKSTRLPEKAGDATFWTFDLFCEELENLVRHLNLHDKGFSIVGPSWGGMLGAAYACTQPRGLKQLVISNAPASVPLAVKGINQLLSELPPDVYKTILDCHEKGDYDSPEYKTACAVFMRRHLCLIDPMPKELADALKSLGQDRTAFHTIHGPSEFKVTGSYKDWEGWREAHKIQAETLLIDGKYGQIVPMAVEPWFLAIPKIKWVTMQNSSHMPQYEEKGPYIEVIAHFLKVSFP
ncbi:proline-specific peptidase [Thozetella sp. PMI_491]|nr:proline-specific peptidase [Thozetella sp. PMI_491]